MWYNVSRWKERNQNQSELARTHGSGMRVEQVSTIPERSIYDEATVER